MIEAAPLERRLGREWLAWAPEQGVPVPGGGLGPRRRRPLGPPCFEERIHGTASNDQCISCRSS